MKNTDDGTLSLFGDELPPAPAPTPKPAKAPAEKKPRAKRKPKEPIAESNDTNEVVAKAVEAVASTNNEATKTATETNIEVEVLGQPNPLVLLATVEPQPRRNSPWAAAVQAKTEPQNSPTTEATSSTEANQAHKPHVMMVITKGEAGGAQSHVLALCEALRNDIHFTVVIGGPTEGSVLAQQLTALGITVCPLPQMVESLLPWRLWPAVQGLVALIAAHPPDLIHTHSAIAGLTARLASQRTERPVVYTVHGFGFKPQVPWLRRHMANLAERAMAGWTTQMICVSEHERELAYQLRIHHERVHVIPNGIAVQTPTISTDKSGEAWLAPSANKNSTTANVPLTTNVPRIIMVARMKSPKRHDLLLRALATVRDEVGFELPLTLAGDGPDRKAFEALSDQLQLEQVRWLGDVHNVPELLQAHDIFVLLSDHEGMPITVLEAMRAGVAILASDLPGIREQIIHNQEGLLCANNEIVIVQQLLRLVQEPYLRKRLGRAAQEHFQNTFTVDHMARQVQAVYQQCLADDASTSRPAAALASATARRRDTLLNWTLWGAWLLLPSLLLAQALENATLMTYQFGDTVWWCAIPYAIASWLLMRNAHLPAAERSGVLWVATLAPFLFTPLGFALLQQPYSRAAVVWCYAITTLWLWLGYRRLVKHSALRLAYFDADVPQQLHACMSPQTPDAQHIELLHWDLAASTPLPACDGLVLDRHVAASETRTRLLGQLKMQHLRLYSVQSVAELLSGRKMLPTQEDNLWEIDNDPTYDRIKRLIDVALVLLLSPLWVPLSAIVAAAVLFDSPGPAFFGQSRVGRDGQLFKLWKFRSMVHGLQAPGVHFAQAEDPRITRVGRFLRRSRLDELPQLWNVLHGHMSLIGPRPEQAGFVREFATTIPSYPYRHLVRPGLTGWAQVQQGYADSAESTRLKLSYDLYYVAHYSLALDLLIAVKTIKTICTGFGAR
jgi:lipopolysaccharide/colanic/teichoic acid biosynthesis glycosyltransferase/glycosyltransferase involved in cell wall biosynthesis